MLSVQSASRTVCLLQNSLRGLGALLNSSVFGEVSDLYGFNRRRCVDSASAQLSQTLFISSRCKAFGVVNRRLEIWVVFHYSNIDLKCLDSPATSLLK